MGCLKRMQYPIQLPVYHSHFTNIQPGIQSILFSVFSHNKKLIYMRIRLTVVPSQCAVSTSRGRTGQPPQRLLPALDRCL